MPQQKQSGPSALAPPEETITEGWGGGVKGELVKEEGHATQVIQFKVYRPWRPEISASVNEKFYHNVNG